MFSMDASKSNRVVVLGIGAFTQAMLRILAEEGGEVSAYLTRAYGHYGPRSEARCISAQDQPNPCD